MSRFGASSAFAAVMNGAGAGRACGCNRKRCESSKPGGIRSGHLQRIQRGNAGHEAQLRQLCCRYFGDLTGGQNRPIEHPEPVRRAGAFVLDLVIEDRIAAGIAGRKQLRRREDLARCGIHDRGSGRDNRRGTHLYAPPVQSGCVCHATDIVQSGVPPKPLRIPLAGTNPDATTEQGHLATPHRTLAGVGRGAFARNRRRNSKAFGPPARAARIGMLCRKEYLSRELVLPGEPRGRRGPSAARRIRIGGGTEFNSIFTVYGRVVAGRTGAISLRIIDWRRFRPPPSTQIRQAVPV